MAAVRVLVADDHSISCQLLVCAVVGQPGLTVIGQAHIGEAAQVAHDLPRLSRKDRVADSVRLPMRAGPSLDNVDPQ